MIDVQKAGTGRVAPAWARGIWWVPVLLFAGVAITWIWATASGRVELNFLGDEAPRLLGSYKYASLAELLELLTSKDSWFTLHPPGDIAYKSVVNQVGVNFAHDSELLVRLHKTLSALSVATGLALIGFGLATRVSKLAAAVFVAIATASVAVTYTAHHAIAEAPTVLLVGLAVYLVLLEPWNTKRGTVAAAVPIMIAGLFRPEAALIFSSLALLPLLRGNWRRALLFGAVAAGPTLALVVGTELLTSDVSYASVRPFAGREIWELLSDERLSRLIWGLGIAPWVGIALIVGLATGALMRRIPAEWLRPALMLSLLWVFWGLGFVVLIAMGVIPQQERVFVFPALFGALAIAMLGDAAALRGRDTRVLATSLAVVVMASGLLAWQGLTELPRLYDSWERRVPLEATEVNEYLAVSSNPDGSVLLDWMFFWEWPAGVYASLPGFPGGACNYLVCSDAKGNGPPAELTAGLTRIETERLSAAWRFMAATAPKHIVMLTDNAYEDWLEYQTTNPEELSSFARPLLRPDGECFTTHEDLPRDRYCPVLTNGQYVVLERQG